MKRLELITAVVLLCHGCSSSTPASPKVAPEQPSQPVAAEESPAVEIAVVEEAVEPERFPDQALDLVEAGREIQQTRGEGGAEEAIATYKGALEKDPLCKPALWELGWSYQVAEKLDEAVKVWDQLHRIDPDYPEFEVHYPVLLMRRDQHAALAALPETGSLPEPEEVPRSGPSLTLHAVGDVHLGRAWPKSRATLPPKDAKDMFTAVRDDLRSGSVTFGNLETVLADSGPSSKCGPKSTKCFSFRVPTTFAAALNEAGFDVMSIANNHTGDFGQAGRETTIAALDGVKILHSGPVGDIASWETNGLRIGLVAFSTGGGVYRIQKIDLARKIVADIDRTHDLVIVSFHGGAEGSAAAHVTRKTEMFYGENRGNVYEFAHALIDAGADLILGHGPHRLRAMEIYRGRLIAYSLGNFSTWNTFSLQGPLGLTVILKATLAPNGVVTSAEIVPVQIVNPGRPKPDPKGRAIAIVRDLSRQDFGDPLFDKNGKWKRTEQVSQNEAAQIKGDRHL